MWNNTSVPYEGFPCYKSATPVCYSADIKYKRAHDFLGNLITLRKPVINSGKTFKLVRVKLPDYLRAMTANSHDSIFRFCIIFFYSSCLSFSTFS